MSAIVIVGTGELARLAHSFLRDIDGLEPVAATVGAEYLDGAELAGLPVVAFEELEDSYPPDDHELLVCAGYRRVNRGREHLTKAARERGYRLATLAHPAAWISPDASLGDGCIVFPRALVEPYATIGAGGVLWSGSVVAHDSRLGDFCFLAPNATIAGNVTLGERCFVGANATLRDGISLGPDCVVGAGAVLKYDAAPGTVFPAAPTRPGERPSSSYDTL